MRPRIRTVKPDIFHDEQLWALGESTGMPVLQGFEGLWCYSDREGRFEWRPMALKSLILPYWSGDFEALLDALVGAGMVVKYTVGGRVYGWVKNLLKHQSINAREPASVLPPPPDNVVHVHAYADTESHGDAPGEWEGNGKGMGSGKGMGLSRGRELPPPSSEVPKQEGMTGEGQGIPATWHSLKGWSMSAELRAEAIIAGVPAGDIDRRVKDLGLGPIGGTRGTIDRDDYVRQQFGRWKTWGETERAKAMAPPPSGRVGKHWGGSWAPSAKHLDYAASNNLDVASVLDAYRRESLPDERPVAEADKDFGCRLTCWHETGAFIAKGPLPKRERRKSGPDNDKLEGAA